MSKFETDNKQQNKMFYTVNKPFPPSALVELLSSLIWNTFISKQQQLELE